MVDRYAIEHALQLVADDTWKAAEVAAQDANAKASLSGRVASDAHNRMLTDGVSKAFGAGLQRMQDTITAYAGAKASDYADCVTDAADRLQVRLVEAHKARLEVLERGKYRGVMQHEVLFMGNFTASLTALRETAVSNARHTLSDPEDVLTWWERHRHEVWLGVINAVISAVISAAVAWSVAAP